VLKFKTMKREKKSEAVKKNILDVSRDLIKAQGYKKTTVRQIMKKAEVRASTLYHFFSDKEDILFQIGVETYTTTNQVVKKIKETKEDPILGYILERVFQLKMASKYRNIAEIFLDFDSSWHISQKRLPEAVEEKKALFYKYNKDFTDQDYYIRTIALIGIRWSLFKECVYEGGDHYEAQWPFLVEMELLLFNVPKPVIKKTIEKTAKVINRDSSKIMKLLCNPRSFISV
jgi:AcrR family transcriptional regulator